MLKDIKLGFKLLKYSYSFKMNVGLSIFFLVIGSLMMLVGVDSFVFGGVYCYIGIVIVLQMSYSLLFVQVVSASYTRKMLEITFPNFISLFGSILWFLILTVLTKVFSCVRPQLEAEYSAALVLCSIFMIICMLYYGGCYKYFVVGTVLFSITFMVAYIWGRYNLLLLLTKMVGTDLPVAFGIGLVIILIGWAISCLLRKLLYKKQISPWAMGSNLRKAMQ